MEHIPSGNLLHSYWSHGHRNLVSFPIKSMVDRSIVFRKRWPEGNEQTSWFFIFWCIKIFIQKWLFFGGFNGKTIGNPWENGGLPGLVMTNKKLLKMSNLELIYLIDLLKMVMFHRFLYVYQRLSRISTNSVPLNYDSGIFRLAFQS